MLSMLVPVGPNVSDAATRSGALGAAAAVSIVTVSEDEAALRSEERRVGNTGSAWSPSASTKLVIVQLPEPSATVEPRTVVPSVSYSVTVELASDRHSGTVGWLS